MPRQRTRRSILQAMNHSAPPSGGRARSTVLLVLCLLPCLLSCQAGEGSVADLPRVDWRVMTGLDLATGEVSPELDALLGRPVRIPGFIVPFEDSLSSVSTFLLVPNFGACIHLPPPLPNQMVLVELDAGQNVDVDLWEQDPIWAVGTLQVNDSDSPWGAVGFAMKAQAAVQFADGMAAGEVW